jgi:hypothetical protein
MTVIRWEKNCIIFVGEPVLLHHGFSTNMTVLFVLLVDFLLCLLHNVPATRKRTEGKKSNIISHFYMTTIKFSTYKYNVNIMFTIWMKYALDDVSSA